ncbi:MAG: hypothetical protein JJU16_02790 [Alkalibacterium sp.]|nr:hypothetical protein [Alkalibacterium sp.]
MNTITANPMFSSIVVLIVGVIVWFGLSDGEMREKKAILSIFMDVVFYFVLFLFGFNAILNLSEIIEVPYRVLLFSSPIVWLATLSIVVYGGIKYGRPLWENPSKAKSVSVLLTLIGLSNHLYLYFLYSSTYALRFIGLYLILLLLLSFTSIVEKVNPVFVLLGTGIVHALLMGGHSTIYFNFAFNAIPLLTLFLVLSAVLMFQRRKSLSQQN